MPCHPDSAAQAQRCPEQNYCASKGGVVEDDDLDLFEKFSSNYYLINLQVHSSNSRRVFVIPPEFVESIVHDSIVWLLHHHSCEPDKMLLVPPLNSFPTAQRFVACTQDKQREDQAYILSRFCRTLSKVALTNSLCLMISGNLG